MLFVFVFYTVLSAHDLLGNPLGSLVCEVFLCFSNFPIWCPGAGVVLDCIDSRSFPSILCFVEGMFNLWTFLQILAAVFNIFNVVSAY